MIYDLTIIGGGINGCGIARDASLRGLKVLLIEKGDFASATSSASTKLIHGGLRYLEHYEFGLVRHALQEREVLWELAPHIIEPMRFTLPLHEGLRPEWLLRTGLFLYDHLDLSMTLPKTSKVSISHTLKPQFTKGFEYSDLWVDDARLTLLNALDAQKQGAVCYNYCGFTKAAYNGTWQIETDKFTATSRALVNATGASVNEINALCGVELNAKIRAVKGSHLVLNRAIDRPYIFQNDDGRVLFAIPYQGDFTLLGTTDIDVTGEIGCPQISPQEVDYLLKEAALYFQIPFSKDEIKASYSGIRPLFDDGASEAKAATRDYVLKHDEERNFLAVYGGKITTYRRLSEEVMNHFSDTPSLSKQGKLLGGEFDKKDKAAVFQDFCNSHKSHDLNLLSRLFNTYGLQASAILNSPQGGHFGSGLYENEVKHLIKNEFVRTSEDILKRRTKLYLRDIDTAKLDAYLNTRLRGV